jgi:multicomponent Na+:H+ antiporter subunit E
LKHAAWSIVVLAGVWLLWSGHYTPLILSFGAASILLVVYLSKRLGVLDEEGAPSHIAWNLITYTPWLIKEIVLANLDVAKRILDPGLPIQPQWVVTHGDQKTALGLTIYANSITLTPGTVTVDIQGHALLIHAICDAAATGLQTDEMNRRCVAVEGFDQRPAPESSEPLDLEGMH